MKAQAQARHILVSLCLDVLGTEDAGDGTLRTFFAVRPDRIDRPGAVLVAVGADAFGVYEWDEGTPAGEAARAWVRGDGPEPDPIPCGAWCYESLEVVAEDWRGTEILAGAVYQGAGVLRFTVKDTVDAPPVVREVRFTWEPKGARPVAFGLHLHRSPMPAEPADYDSRCRALEAEGLTRSDAQAVVDAQLRDATDGRR